MIYSSQFGGGLALGSIVQGIGLAEPQYVACDGRPVLRASYPRLSALFPVGRLTGTVRTLASEPNAILAVASPTYLVAAAAASTACVQYSTDGAAWSTTSVSITGGGAMGGLIWAGNRFVVAFANVTAPAVTTGDNPNSTWTATTGGFASVTSNGQATLAYSASLGRVVAVSGDGSISVKTLDNGSTTWVSRSGLLSLARRSVCWTGSKYIIQIDASAQVSTSSDGITWAESATPEAPTTGLGGIASNGAGVAVITGVPTGLLVSTDHGATWVPVAIPGVAASDAWRISYSGDRFFVGTAAGVAMSLNGLDWFIDSHAVQARVATSVFAKKGSAFAQIQSGTATAYSFTESATEFAAPNLRAASPGPSGSVLSLAPLFIKAL